MAKKHKPAPRPAPKPAAWQPTDDDPLCECGAAKHDHHLGTGGYAGADESIECDEFAEAK